MGLASSHLPLSPPQKNASRKSPESIKYADRKPVGISKKEQ